MLEVQYRQLVLCPHYYTVDSTDSVAGWSGPIYVMDLWVKSSNCYMYEFVLFKPVYTPCAGVIDCV